MFQTSTAVYLRSTGIWDFAFHSLLFGCERYSGQHFGVIFKGAATHGCLSFEDWPDMVSGTSVPGDQHEQRNNSEEGRPQILLIYEANAKLPSVLSKTYASLQVSRAV